MPLIPGKSKAAFSHNVSAEVHAGKPVKQAVAIAYSEKRRHHMAEGGEVMAGEDDRQEDDVLMDHVAMEAMTAIEHKDKAAFREALHVLVAHMMSEMSDQEEMNQ